MAEFVTWLRGLAEKGGKGVVNNIDARCLGRIADQLEQRAALVKALDDLVNAEALAGVAEYERDRYLTALRRIVSLEKKNVPKYAQEIARDAVNGDVGGSGT